MTIRSTGALFNDAFAFYKSHAKLLIGITIFPGALQAIVSYLAPIEGQAASGLVSGILLIIALVVAVAVSIVSVAALVLATADPMKYRNPIEALEAGGMFFLPMLWVMVLSVLAYMGGFLLLIIPGIIFAVWFAFSYFTLVLEGKRGTDAMKTSKGYVRGRWWPVAGRIFAVIVVMLAVSFIVEVLLGMVMPTKSLHNAVSALISSLYSPFMLVYMYFMYHDLKTTPVEEVAAPVSGAAEAAAS
jgi:hypothetical protein